MKPGKMPNVSTVWNEAHLFFPGIFPMKRYSFVFTSKQVCFFDFADAGPEQIKSIPTASAIIARLPRRFIFFPSSR